MLTCSLTASAAATSLSLLTSFVWKLSGSTDILNTWLHRTLSHLQEGRASLFLFAAYSWITGQPRQRLGFEDELQISSRPRLYIFLVALSGMKLDVMSGEADGGYQ